MKFITYLVGFTTLLLLALTFTLMWGFGNETQQMWGAGLLAVELVYIGLGFGILHVDQVGASFLLGKPLGNLRKKGVYWVLFLIVRVRKENGNIMQNELPGEPEQIFWEDAPVPTGKYPPIRVLFGPPDPADVLLKDNPYNKAMVVAVTPVVEWKINDLTVFYEEVGSKTNALKLLTDAAVAVFFNEFSLITPAKALQTLPAINKKIKDALERRCISWGVDIVDGYVKPFGFSHGLNTAVVAVSISEQRAQGYSAEQKAIVEWKKRWLIDTGLATVNTSGEITGLVPDANVRVSAEAIKELSNLKGTLVLGGDDLKTMLGIGATNSAIPTIPVTTTTATP